MPGRWVCLRCYESNDAAVEACTRCGLDRGGDPAQAAPLADAPADDATPTWTRPASPARPAWQALLLRFGWVGVVIAIAAVGIFFNARRDDSGQISAGGNLQVQDLRVGDCFTLKDEDAETVGEVDARRCGEAHAYELFHVSDVVAAEYPSDVRFTQFIDEECVPAFTAYVGRSYAESALELGTFTPTSESWDAGDHSVQCVLYDPSGAQLVGSMRAAAR